MKASQWYKILVALALVLVTGFQVYWLKDTFNRERQALTVKTTGMFNEMVRAMQDSALQARIPITVMTDTPQKKSVAFNTIKRSRPTPPQQDVRIARVAAALQHQTRNLDSMPQPGSIMITIVNDSFTFNTSTKAILDSLSPDKISKILLRSGKKNRDSLSAIPTLRFLDTIRTVFLSKDTQVAKAKPAIKGKIDNVKVSWRSTPAPDKNERELPRAGTTRPTQVTFVLDSLFKNLLPDTVVQRSFARLLTQEKLPIDFSVRKADSTDRPAKPQRATWSPTTPDQGVFKLQLGTNTAYLLNSIKLPILFSIFLVGVTVFSFWLLYRSWQKQKRLTDIKNEFISNITHELKTPIATVGVAMEALSNFNALNNPERAKEYIDISKQELSRLSLLVDKVLKLSMFENREIDLQQAPVDLQELTREVINSMRLQIEKRKATCDLEVLGNSFVKGDRMHLLSVVYNLLDNALKYSNEKPEVQISIRENEQAVVLQVSDNGIGIAPEYTGKIFDKFFRVPHGNVHTNKGYGLGLSYVWQVVQKHGGTIEVFSKPEQGTTFTISLPKLS